MHAGGGAVEQESAALVGRRNGGETLGSGAGWSEQRILGIWAVRWLHSKHGSVPGVLGRNRIITWELGRDAGGCGGAAAALRE